MTNYADWFAEAYDRAIAAAGVDGLPLEKTRDTLANAYADAVESGDIERYQTDPFSEGKRLFDAYVSPVRDKRKRSMKKQCEYLVAALVGNPEEEANIDALLDVAFPVGRADGTDKALRYWSADDWATSRTERYRNAADAARAAQDYDIDVVEPVISAINRRGVRVTGDLFPQ